MPGDYTTEELQSMPREDFEAAVARNFAKPVQTTQVNLGTAVPPQIGAKRDPNAWKNAKKGLSKDFTCPSGQTCRLRPLSPEMLLGKGILDKVTRLEGLASQLVDTAEGQAPAPDKLPSRGDLEMLLDTINVIVPMAVEEPALAEVPEDESKRDPELIYVDDVDLEDRMAILEEALKGLRLLDRFRNPR